MLVLILYMQKIALYGSVIYFTVVSLLPGHYTTQISNINSLRNHFFLHLAEKSTSSDLTWFDFLVAHFWDSSKHHHDHPFAHKDLPLYNQINSQNPVLCNYYAWQLYAPEETENSLVIIESARPDHINLDKIFLPPRS